MPPNSTDRRKPTIDTIAARATWRGHMYDVRIERVLVEDAYEEDGEEHPAEWATEATVWDIEEGEESADRFPINYEASVDTMVKEAVMQATN